MSKKDFTDEHRKEQEANPYTKLVSSHYIRFTDTSGRNSEADFLSEKTGIKSVDCWDMIRMLSEETS